jgi:hypothetical protein
MFKSSHIGQLSWLKLRVVFLSVTSKFPWQDLKIGNGSCLKTSNYSLNIPSSNGTEPSIPRRNRLLLYKLTSGFHDNSCMLRKPQFHLVHNILPLVPIMSHIKPVQAFSWYFFKMRFSIILPVHAGAFRFVFIIQVFLSNACMCFPLLVTRQMPSSSHPTSVK